ncbi:MAG: hypothetical protein BACD_04264 [Bacteroides rodentium]
MYAEIMILQPERACGKDSVPFICVQRVDFLHRKLLWMAKLFYCLFHNAAIWIFVPVLIGCVVGSPFAESGISV